MFISLQFKLDLKNEDKEKLIKLMRKQSSASRTTHNMLKELGKEKTRNLHAQIYHRLRKLFLDLPKTYIDSAIYKAKENGVIAIDTNASPIHLAIAEVSKTGELQSYQTISLHHLLGLSQNSKDHQEWILAHQLIDLAIQKGKAVAIENLKKLKRGRKEDGKAKLRKILYQWNAKKFLQKLKRVAMIKGVEVVEVNPAYTSVIGMLKYAPRLNIDKDVAGAYVIGRRALGFKEDMPENYEKLLKDRAYLEFALKRYEERKKELTGLLEKETSEYKRNALESQLGAYGRNPELASSEGSPHEEFFRTASHRHCL